MKQPSLDEMLKVTGSKYTLVVAAAKRARLLTAGEKALVEGDFIKPVTKAMHEIASGKIIYKKIQ